MRTNISRPGWELLDVGNDSTVYRVDDHVVKIYEPEISLEMLKTYYSDTKRASSMIKDHRDHIAQLVGIFFKGYSIGMTVLEQGRIRQVQPELIGEDGYDKVIIGIGQKYIDATDILDMDSIFHDFTRGRDRNCKTEVKNAINYALDITRRLVTKETGISFDIAPLNVKLIRDKKNKKLELVVTDLATWIDGAYI